MKKFYYLKTCNTCMRIMKELNLSDDVELHELKSNPPTAKEINALQKMTGSYEELFNRRSKLYREQGLHEQELTEADYKKIIPTHYTFLKRPILVLDSKIFAGNAKKTVASAIEALS